MSEVQGKGGIIAKVIEDSLHPEAEGRRLTTVQLRYPRFIHSELMTHRVFSRNASSSRAIPVAKMLKQVREDPAMPIHWGQNQPGMKADAELDDQEKRHAAVYWIEAAKRAADMAEQMNTLGLHKQVANRILEPYQFISVIVTATEWHNFFALRAHKDAQPEIQELAFVMRDAMLLSAPKTLAFGEWHLPYVRAEERKKNALNVCRMISGARCARVSYLTHDGENPKIEKDIELFQSLVGSEPLHASPIEHQATPDPLFNWPGPGNRHLWGNFKEWVQYRKLYELSTNSSGENK